MKKNYFFIIIIIIFVIILYYNNYYENFSIKVQDALIFKDYEDKIIGTYPDKNIYPDLFVKSQGEYVNMIGTFHGATEVNMPKPRDGRKGDKGTKGPKGDIGPQGPEGKAGIDIIQDYISEKSDTPYTCIGSSIPTYMCKGPPGISPEAPPDGNPGNPCPHENGKCPQPADGVPGKSCDQVNAEARITLPSPGKCPKGPPGRKGVDCAVLYADQLTNGKCPPPENGVLGKSCTEVNAERGIIVGSDNKCPQPPNGIPGKTCIELEENLNLPECSTVPIESNFGEKSADCINSSDSSEHNKKYCGQYAAQKISTLQRANDFVIEGSNLIINNDNITIAGDIILPEEGTITLKNSNGQEKIIDKEFINKMIELSKECKQCGDDYWNNSDDCEDNEGQCVQCSTCPPGQRVKDSCRKRADTACEVCTDGKVGDGCNVFCDPKQGQFPNSDKTACNTIQSNEYITDNYEVNTIPSGYFVDPNDYTSIAICDVGYKCIKGVKIKCPPGKYQNETGQTDCKPCTQSFGVGKYIKTPCTETDDTKPGNCPGGNWCDGVNKHICSNCGPGKYISSSCTSISDTQCNSCACGQVVNSSKTGCNWDNNFYQYYHYNLGGGCSKITEDISHNYHGWNRAASSFLIPPGRRIAVYDGVNYTGKCFSAYSAGGFAQWNLDGHKASLNDRVNSIKLDTLC